MNVYRTREILKTCSIFDLKLKVAFYARVSTVACCTNGRVKSKASRLEFCKGFQEMVQRLEPLRVIIVGRMPQELQTDIEIINFKSRNQKIKDREGKYGILN